MNPYLFGLWLDSFITSMKTLKTVLPFLYFEGLTREYLEKASMTHNKYLTFLFLEDNDPISGKFAAHILSLNLA